MPEPTYIYHASRIEGEDDLFEVAVSGRVDCESCTLLYTATQMREAILAATERAAKLDGAVIAAYALPAPDGRQIDEIRIERARQMDGGALWAVRFRGDVLNKNGEWEWEPMPSGRDEDFLARARFDTAEEAIAAAIRGAAASTGRGEGGEGA